MNISSLLTAFTLARADCAPEGEGLPLPEGADFAAIMAPPDIALPAPSPKQPLPKGGEDCAAIVQEDVETPSVAVALPGFWHAIASGLPDLPDMRADHLPLDEDCGQLDVAIPSYVAPPALPSLDPRASDAAGRGVAMSAAQGVATPANLPQGDPRGAQVLAQAQLTELSAQTAPLLDAKASGPSGRGVAMSAAPQAAGLAQALADGLVARTAPLPPNQADGVPESDETAAQTLPPAPDFAPTVSDGARVIAATSPDRVAQSRGVEIQRETGKIAGQEPAAHSPNSPRAPDFERRQQAWTARDAEAIRGPAAQPKAEQAPDSATKTVEQGAQERRNPSQGVDSGAKVEGLGGLGVKPVAQATEQQMPPEKRDQSALTDPFLSPKTAPAFTPLQTLADFGQGRVPASDPLGRLTAKPASGLRVTAQPALPVHPAALPADTWPVQDVQVAALKQLSTAPQGDRSAADFAMAVAGAPDPAFGTMPQVSGSTVMAQSLSPVAAPLAQTVSAPTLQANMPALIEHLHHTTARDGHSQAEVLMNPAELGRIRFDLITQGDQVQITLSVERPETLDLLRANAEALRAEFREAGLTADTLNFGQWAQRAPARDQPEALPDQAAAAQPQAIAAPYIKPVSASGLDLRL